MGCGESKIKKIKLNEGGTDRMIDSVSGKIDMATRLDFREEDSLPNRLQSAIPVSDLGESLDSRHLAESLAQSRKSNGFGLPGGVERLSGEGNGDSGSNNGRDSSADSGYDDYDEEYSHIITEKSDPVVVRKIEDDFQPVELPELLVITGRGVTRILSGYQKNKMEESKILESLRDEGLLAKAKGKTSGGLSFEVVDQSLVNRSLDEKKKQSMQNIRENNENGDINNLSSQDAFISSQLIPKRKLEKLDKRRELIRKPSAKIDQRLAEAESRRKELEESKVKSVIERSGLERHSKLRSASALRRENKYSATVAKRQAHLQDLKDKLKDKHKKNEMVKLKQSLLNDSIQSGRFEEIKDGFFDD